MKRKDYRKQKNKSSGKRRVLKVSLLVLLSLFLVVVAYGVVLQKKMINAANDSYEAIGDRSKSDFRDIVVEPIKDNVSILFIGIDESDTRGKENGRSDALLVATLNQKDKTIKLLSIPRDSRVYIPSKDKKDKINHAHAFGGTSGTIDTVENLLAIPIDYYVKMNFNAFIDVVDALGGIEAEVPYDRLEKDEFDQNTIELKKGLQHLDGQHALALARTRKLDSDVERGKRQQMILEAIMKEVTSVSSITKYGNVIDAVGNNMKTNMRFGEMKAFLEYVKGGKPQITPLNLNGYDEYINHIYYWQLDNEGLDSVQQELQAHLEITPSSSLVTDEGDNPSQIDEIANERDYD